MSYHYEIVREYSAELLRQAEGQRLAGEFARVRKAARAERREARRVARREARAAGTGGALRASRAAAHRRRTGTVKLAA
jgi:hypothetical protein